MKYEDKLHKSLLLIQRQRFELLHMLENETGFNIKAFDDGRVVVEMSVAQRSWVVMEFGVITPISPQLQIILPGLIRWFCDKLDYQFETAYAGGPKRDGNYPWLFFSDTEMMSIYGDPEPPKERWQAEIDVFHAIINTKLFHDHEH